MTPLYYVYPPCGRLLGSLAGEVIDELTLIGTVLGMLVMGHLADRSGRKRWYGVELGVIIVATIGVVQSSEGFMVLASDGTYQHSMDIYSWIAWWRFMIGFGIGSEVLYALTPVPERLQSLKSLLVSAFGRYHRRVGLHRVQGNYVGCCLCDAVTWKAVGLRHWPSSSPYHQL